MKKSKLFFLIFLKFTPALLQQNISRFWFSMERVDDEK